MKNFIKTTLLLVSLLCASSAHSELFNTLKTHVLYNDGGNNVYVPHRLAIDGAKTSIDVTGTIYLTSSTYQVTSDSKTKNKEHDSSLRVERGNLHILSCYKKDGFKKQILWVINDIKNGDGSAVDIFGSVLYLIVLIVGWMLNGSLCFVESFM